MKLFQTATYSTFIPYLNRRTYELFKVSQKLLKDKGWNICPMETTDKILL